ncbi:MAG: LptF/LptG family permease [Prevotellaceae bacterium]|nr:LptF/LptG family permease [Prevotellaceae bacterium]
MRILDKFILRAYFGPMALTFFIVLFVLLLQFLWVYIDELIGKGLSVGVVCEFMFWAMASFVPLALPLSTMLSSIMTMGSFGENNELLAMKATGIPLQRILRPLMVLSVVISIGAFFAANNLIPYANFRIRTTLYDIKQKREEIKIPAGVFYNGIENITLFVSRQDEKSGLMHDIMFYDHRAKKGNTNVTLADSGYIRLTQNKQHVVFTLYNGETYEEGDRRSRTDTTLPFQRRLFNEQTVLMPLEGYDFKRSDGSRFRDDAQTLHIGRLSFLEDSLESLLTANRDRFVQSIFNANFIPRGFEMDSATQNRYIYSAPFDSLFHALPVEKQLKAAQQAKNGTDRMLTQIITFTTEQEQNHYSYRRMRIEWNSKFALSIACLIFFFIGAPLGAIIRKGGLGMPTVVSIFFFIIYWVIDITGRRLSRDGAWDPTFGTWISSCVLLPIGIFLTYKATTDSALLNADKYVTVFKAIFKKRNRNKTAANNQPDDPTLSDIKP